MSYLIVLISIIILIMYSIKFYIFLINFKNSQKNNKINIFLLKFFI